MKTVKLMIILPLMALFILNAQAKSQTIGLYLTEQDYLNHKLSYSTGNDKIKVGGLFETNYVILIHDGKKEVLKKNEIFGYSKDGQDYRFFNNAEYRILSNKGLSIYSHTTLVQQGKGPKPTELYYFSSGLSSPIQQLTLANIRSTYAKYPKFVYSVESLFKSDNELAAYGNNNEEYKIAWLYSQNAM
jgi:hypothetical protein